MPERSEMNTAANTSWLKHLEDRIHRQQKWLKCYSQPIVTFTVNTPQPIKNDSLTETIFSQGIEALIATSAERGWPVTARQILHKTAGPEAIFVINTPSASLLKAAMMKVEHSHKLGHLMNLDVIGTDGVTISRSASQMPRRKCFICGKEKGAFTYSHRHEIKVQIAKIKEMVEGA